MADTAALGFGGDAAARPGNSDAEEERMDGSLDWSRWLEYRLLPSGPLALVEALQGAALGGCVEQLRAAIAQVEEQGEGLPRSLDQTPRPAAAREAAGSRQATGLWTWALARLEHLEQAETELAALLAEAQEVVDRSVRGPGQHRRTSILPGENLSSSAPLQRLRNSITKVQRRCSESGASRRLSATIHRVFFVRTQEALSEMTHRLEERLQSVDEVPGLCGGVREDADVMLRKLKDAQEALFERFLEFSAPVEQELRDAYSGGLEGTSQCILRLREAVLNAQREVGARLLLGEVAIQEAQGKGLGLSATGEEEPPNPWSLLKRTPPPWEASFRRATSRLYFLRGPSARACAGMLRAARRTRTNLGEEHEES